VRLVYDGDPVWANEWADDTLTNGSNNSLYHFLKNQGLPIDSFNAPRTFGFIFKKNDSTNFSPKYKFSNGLYDRVILSVDFNSKDTLGFVSSPKFGPAKAWKNVKWNGYGSGNNFESLNIIGVSSEGVETKLYTLDTLQTSVDISSVNVIQYPYIKLRTSNQDSITAKAYQLNNWSVEYDAVAEGAIAPNLYFNIPDSVGIATSYASDTLKGGVAFKNISKVNFDSLTVKLLLINQRLGTIYTFNLPKTKILVAGDTVHIDFAVNVALLPQDNYNLYLVINENGTQPEQYLFNNNLYKYVYLKTSVIVPVRLLNFNAKPLGNLVEINWDVTEEINIGKYEIEYSTNALDFNKIGSINAKGVNGNSNYLFYHNNPINGVNYYRLKMINIDGSYSFSPIRVVNFIKTSTIKIYPNPVINSLTVSVNKQDNKLNTVKLYNNVGQLIITKSFAINTQLDLTSLASGTYLIRVDDGTEIKIFTIQKK
jgi:hypothetical protein